MQRAKLPLFLGIAFLTWASVASALTSSVGSSRYEITEGVSFDIDNAGASDFLFSWTDPGSGSASFSNIADPTLVLTAGQSYTFERKTGSHPFAITDSSLSVSGSDGSYVRDLDYGDSILDPNADFTSNPGGGDPITWALTVDDIGTYYTICTVSGHPEMTGKIVVVPEASMLPLVALVALVTILPRRVRRA